MNSNCKLCLPCGKGQLNTSLSSFSLSWATWSLHHSETEAMFIHRIWGSPSLFFPFWDFLSPFPDCVCFKLHILPFKPVILWGFCLNFSHPAWCSPVFVLKLALKPGNSPSIILLLSVKSSPSQYVQIVVFVKNILSRVCSYFLWEAWSNRSYLTMTRSGNSYCFHCCCC